jgi:hypothetical protein
MKLIQENPYRIVGVLSNASAKEIQSRKGKITAYAKVGKQVSSEYDFPFLHTIEKEHDNIEKAFSAIQQSKEMLDNSLFWFLKTNSFDETAISYLINGDKNKAIEILEKVTMEKDVTSKNFSCFNNLGTLKLLGSNKSEIKQGIEAKLKLIESIFFKNYVEAVAGEAFVIDNKKQLEIFLDELLNQLKGKYTDSSTLKLFENCNESTKKYLAVKFTLEPIHQIESSIESTKKKRTQFKIDAYKFGTQLYNDCKSNLDQLKSLLGVNDLKYKLIADNLAKEIMQCGIDYFNKSKENNSTEDYLENAMRLNKLAESIAVGKLTKDRARDQIVTLEEMKDQELSEAIAVLKSIKDLYLENERKVRKQVQELERDHDIILGFKTINHSAVEDSIRNSIEWGKVNEMLVTLLSDNNLKKIKESDRFDDKKEFWELINWTEDTSSKASTISRIISTYKNIPPKLCFEILSAEVTNIHSNSQVSKKPFYIEDIRYVGLKLKVNSTRTQKVVIYKKYINPLGICSLSSKTTQKGYSSSDEITITPESKTIELGGFGNAKVCTFMVGVHKIEIYAEHHKVHTITFTVDWSPEKKTELTKRIKLLENELIEVEQFHWFRTFETKKKDVAAVQAKIYEAKQTLMNK